MGTGIVGIALRFEHRLSGDALLALAGLISIALAIVLGSRAHRDRGRFRSETRTPAALTWIAATAVLGTGAAEVGWSPVAIALLALGGSGWLLLVGRVCRALAPATAGDAFMLTVAPEGLAALSALIAVREHAVVLAGLAIALGVVGLVLYPVVLRRFELRTLASGSGEQWVAGGSLAISALAFAQIALAAARLSSLRGGAPALRDAALILWFAAIAWIPALVIAELRRPRARYRANRWSMVFPLGMYAACSFSVAAATGAAAIGDFARAWIWVAVAGWAIVLIGMIRRGRRRLSIALRRSRSLCGDWLKRP